MRGNGGRFSHGPNASLHNVSLFHLTHDLLRVAILGVPPRNSDLAKLWKPKPRPRCVVHNITNTEIKNRTRSFWGDGGKNRKGKKRTPQQQRRLRALRDGANALQKELDIYRGSAHIWRLKHINKQVGHGVFAQTTIHGHVCLRDNTPVMCDHVDCLCASLLPGFTRYTSPPLPLEEREKPHASHLTVHVEGGREQTRHVAGWCTYVNHACEAHSNAVWYHNMYSTHIKPGMVVKKGEEILVNYGNTEYECYLCQK